VSDAAHPLDAPVWQARGDAAAIHAAGDTPLLSSYADNDGAIALYRRLGFAIRRDLVFSLFERQ
jgi:ribosomal protein S18 acetylase RimI-like enzyme